MRSKTFNGIRVYLFTDPHEFTREFFDIPDGAILDTYDLPESAGFSSIDDRRVWLFARKDCSFEDLLATVAHEVGHIVEGGFRKNPPQTQRYARRHEQKAEHYEQFAILVYDISKYFYELIR